MSDGISEELRNPLGMFDVKGQTAIVTGATGAFGRGISIVLGSLGANLTLAGANEEELEKVADEVRKVGGQAATISVRPNSLEDAEAIRQVALDNFGGIKMLAIGSGFNKAGFIHEMEYEDWQNVMDANVRGAWFMAKAVGTYFLENEVKGKVLLMSSVRGRHGNISGYTAYCTSKGATDSLTRVLATEWSKFGITVNAIAPTVFRSNLTAWMYGDDELGQATKARSMARIPLGRLGEVEDLMGMALYLLSPASDFCTGQVMYVDGGFTAG